MTITAPCCLSAIPFAGLKPPCFDNARDESGRHGRRGCCGFRQKRTACESICGAGGGDGGGRGKPAGSSSSISSCFFGAFLRSCLVANKVITMQGKVRVAADYPESKPDASPVLGDMGYHPLEDISNLERKRSIELADRRLTDAEMARTLAEEKSDAIVFTSVISDHDNVFAIEVPYLVDEHGDFYLQVYNDSEFISTLNNTESYKHAVIGYGSIDDWIIEHENIQDYNIVEDFEYDSSDLSEEVWIMVSPETVELALEPIESAGDWAGLDTLSTIHPMEFVERLTKVVSTDYLDKMRNPSNSLRIVGEVRRLDEEEESYVQRIWYDQFRWDAEYTEGSEDTEGSEEEILDNVGENSKSENNEDMHKSVVEQSSSSGIVENSELSEAGTSFFKLDIKSIQLLRGYAHQSFVDLLEFRQSKPDILAQSAVGIIEHFNNGGKKVENALKQLCRRRKGVHVEEAYLIGLDSYGVDLRIHLGREVQTLRISFSQKATSVENAKQLLKQLLFPPFRHKERRQRRFRSRRNT